jgi:hypothetical protein
MKTMFVKMTPQEETSNGGMLIKEWGQPMDLHFLQVDDFRGTLISVEWNGPDNVKHTITPADEDFALFQQVGERPEIVVPSSWFESLGLSGTFVLRLRFQFQTFRQEPVWYAYLYFKNAYGDQDPAYKVPSSTVHSGCSGCGTGSCPCQNCQGEKVRTQEPVSVIMNIVKEWL